MRRGFTLLECLFALFILMVLFLSLIPALSNILFLRQRRAESEDLFFVAHNAMEMIRANHAMRRPLLEGVQVEQPYGVTVQSEQQGEMLRVEVLLSKKGEKAYAVTLWLP